MADKKMTRRPSMRLNIPRSRERHHPQDSVSVPDKWNMITEQIYIASASSMGITESFLEDETIDTVISLSKSEYSIPSRVEHIERSFPDVPSINLDEYDFEHLCEYLDLRIKEGKKIVVNCERGISRSVTLVAFWLMKHRNMSLMQALEFIREKRPCAEPNLGFMSYLSLKEAQ